MGFRENLLRKIQIDQLAGRVLATIGPLGSEVKLDKEAMRTLLTLSPYAPQRVRDLDLYVEDSGTPSRRSSFSTMNCPSTGRRSPTSPCAKAPRGRCRLRAPKKDGPELAV